MTLLLVDIDNNYLFGINEQAGMNNKNLKSMFFSLQTTFCFSEPIRNEILDKFGQLEKLKCSLASPNHLISVYDSRLGKIKIYDFRFLTVSLIFTSYEQKKGQKII